MGSSFGGYHNPQLIPAENPMDQYAKALSIKGQMQQQQMGDIQLQQAQQAQKDQQTLGQLMVKNKGDIDKVIQDAPDAGVMPNTILALKQHALDVKSKVTDLVSKQGAIAQQQADLMLGAHDAVDKADPKDKPVVYQQQLQALQKQNVDVSQMPPQYPGDEQFRFIGATVQGHAKQVAQAFEERKVQAEEMASQARKTAADATADKSGPLAPPVIPQLNNGLAARWNVLNPGQPPPEWAQIGPGAKKEDFDRADKMLEQVEKAQGTKAQQDTANAMKMQAQATSQAAAAERSDKMGREPVVGQDKNGRTVLVSAADANKMGLTGQMKADTDLVNKAQAARDWKNLATTQAPPDSPPSEMGIMQLINKMDKEGKLGAVASRWNEFMAGTVGAGDPEVSALRAKMGLSTTKLMQAHVGSRGGAFMLEHFEDLANAKKMDASTLRSAMQSEVNYMKDVAKDPADSIPPKAATGGTMINVQIPGHPPGKIPAKSKAQFLKDHPDATFQ